MSRKPPNDPNSVYSIWASLGLDASSLDAGLAKIEPQIERTIALLNALQAAGIGPAAALKAVGSAMIDPRSGRYGEGLVATEKEDPRRLIRTDTDIVAKLTANAELQREATQRKALETESLNETRRINNQKKIEQTREIASDREYVALKRQISAQVQASEKEFIAHRKQAVAEANMVAQEQRLAEVRARGGEMSRGGIGAEIRSSFYLGGALQAMGVNVPMGLTSILGRLDQVQLAMAAAFNVLAIGAFVQILAGVAQKIGEVTDEWIGFGKEAQNAWDKARVGAIESVLELNKYKEAVRSISEVNFRRGEGKEEKLSNIAETRADLRASIAKLGEHRNEAQRMLNIITQTDQSQKRVDVRGLGNVTEGRAAQLSLAKQIEEGLIPGARNTSEAMEVLKKNVEEDNVGIAAHTDELKRLQLEEMRVRAEKERETKELRQRRDPVHEMPWRIPWFMRENPAQFFMESLKGAPARRGDFPGAPPELVHRSATGSQAGVTIQNYYSPTMKFDGVPADAQAFYRDKMQPIMMEDYRSNSREVTDKLVSVLRNAGVQVG